MENWRKPWTLTIGVIFYNGVRKSRKINRKKDLIVDFIFEKKEKKRKKKEIKKKLKKEKRN